MENSKDVILKKNSQDIVEKIIDETDLEKVKDLTHLFNINIAKKNAIRVLTIDNLIDKVTNQIEARFEKYPDNFSNTELLNYLQVLQSSVDKANKNLTLVDESPAIQLTQNNVNVNILDSMSRESKEKIAAFLKYAMNQKEESEPILIEEEPKDDTQKSE